MSLSRRRTRSNPKDSLHIQEEIGTIRSTNVLELARTTLSKKILNATVLEQKQMTDLRFREMYPGLIPRDIQLNTTVSLLNGLNVFLLAATGLGKSRVSELFFHMFPKTKKAVILVLNPLDALGDNQVLEKRKSGISAVNLTKTSFTKEVLNDLKRNDYSFIYLSPEIFLNSGAFQTLYHSKEFQSHLVLKVVDEAHCIYLWGLQVSGASRNFSIHVTPQDIGIFRSSYGNLGQHLMATDNVPMLLMSATCRPQAVSAILASLSITKSHITMIQGELVRPELRFIRIYLNHTLESAEDLNLIIAHKSIVSNENLPPMIIYSGTRNATMNVMEQVCKARGVPNDASNGDNDCIRRYHSVTSENDKLKNAKEYGEGKFPILSATSALGLGQNWPRVRIVVIMGAMDPSDSNQMAGRAGRGGDEGLVILFVQSNMPKGINSAAEVEVNGSMNNEDRMHAVRFTPCCLRVVYALDNLKGYIPMSLTDPGYLEEIERERLMQMGTCRCSNCDPQGSARIIRLLPQMNVDGLDELLKSSSTCPEDVSILQIPKKKNKRKFTSTIPLVCKLTDPIRINVPMIDLVVSILGHHEVLFGQIYPFDSPTTPDILFNREDAWQIAKNYQSVAKGDFLREILGGQTLPGQFEMIIDCINEWFKSDSYLQHQSHLEDIEIEMDQEILDTQLMEEEHQAELQLKSVAKQKKKNEIADRKKIRLAKAVEAAKVKEQKLADKQNKVSNGLNSIKWSNG